MSRGVAPLEREPAREFMRALCDSSRAMNASPPAGANGGGKGMHPIRYFTTAEEADIPLSLGTGAPLHGDLGCLGEPQD